MKRILLTALALTAMAVTSHAVRAETASHRDAVAFVDHAKVGQNLPVIALSVAKQTVTFTVLASKLGNGGAVKAVSDEIDALLPIYQPKWDENIANAYEKSFSEEELSSLAAEGRASKHASKVAAQQSAIGKQMNLTSKPVLADLITQALSVAMSKNP
ncbi:hypothetical protein [Pseudomonas gingeri]|uniref:hypothetical protein n=1 Tax=Pseudomonas gingeri TaxID=117681 RepID=UPI00210EC24F|nr:hypothetical protein [Pseudomonas gingeri]